MNVKAFHGITHCRIKVNKYSVTNNTLCKEFNPNNPKHIGIGEMFIQNIRCEISTKKVGHETIAYPVISVDAADFVCHNECYKCEHFNLDHTAMCSRPGCEYYPPNAKVEKTNLFSLKDFCQCSLKVMSAYNGKILCKSFNPKNPKHADFGTREVVSIWSEIVTRSNGYNNCASAQLCVYVDGKPEYDAEHPSAEHNKLSPCDYCPRNGTNNNECIRCKENGYPCADCDYCRLDADGCCQPPCENCEHIEKERK